MQAIALREPSMVVTALPATASTRGTQERAAWSSTSTEQAPQWPSPQPNFDPVSPSS